MSPQILNRFELRKNKEAASVILPRPDGSVVDIKPAVMNGEGNIINNHDHWYVAGSGTCSNPCVVFGEQKQQ